MEKIQLPTVTISRQKDEITLVHKSGMSASVSVDKLERWATSILRNELKVPAKEKQ